MNLLAALIIGALVGWIAGQAAGQSNGLLTSILIGMAGSFVGSLASAFFDGCNKAYLALSWAGIWWAFIGALVLVLLLNAFRGRTPHQA